MYILDGYRIKDYKTIGNKYYVADFETSATDESQTEVFVYATGMAEVGDKQNKMYYTNNMEDFINNFFLLPTSTSTIYFHNLSFDIEFILNYLTNVKNFKQNLNTYTEFEDYKRQDRRPKNKRIPNFSYDIIYANGTFYQVTLYLNDDKFYDNKGKEVIAQRKIVFKDSYKIVAFPLQKIASDFLSINIPKDGIDHTLIREPNTFLTSEEYKYLYDDVIILKKFIDLILIDGIQVTPNFNIKLDKMTIAGQTLSEFKRLMLECYESDDVEHCRAFKESFLLVDINEKDKRNKKQNELFNKTFPQLDLKIDRFIRNSYFGGITYKNEELVNSLKGDVSGLVYDVNSLYPYVMRTKFLPYGEPIPFTGNYNTSNIDKKEYSLYFQEIEVEKFTLKEGFSPNIQIRNSYHFKGSEYVKNNFYKNEEGKLVNEPCTFVFTNVQLEYFLKSYDVYGIKYIKGYAFKGSYGIYDRYIDLYMEMKKNGKGAVRQTAKLFLNSLYGKFGMNPVKEERIIQYYDGVFSTTNMSEDGELLEFLDKGVYLPIASFITSYAREVLLTAIEPVIDRFLYCDTDSIHITGYEIPNIPIHDKNLGCWKCEGKFTKSKYIGAKRYAEFIDGKWDIKCCGLSRDIMKQLTMDVFDICEIPSKEISKVLPTLYTKDDIFYYWDKECTKKVKGLVRSKKKKYVKGGIIIKEQPYMINDKYLLLR